MTRPIAHRGLHNIKNKIAENSIESFLLAIDKGYNIEIDIRMTADGEIVVVHDNDLERLLGIDKNVNAVTYSEIKDIKLLGSDSTIPKLSEVLAAIDGRTGILIEIKSAFPYKEYVDKIVDILKDYKGDYALQSFSPFIMNYIHKKGVTAPLGVLNGRMKGSLPPVVRLFIEYFFFVSFRPHFIAYEISSFPHKAVDKLRNKGVKIISWTINSIDKLTKAREHSDNFIFELINID